MSLEESDPKYNNIISDVESIISNGIKTILNPFINKMIDSDKQCQTITDVLKQLPEYKKLLQENTELKQNIKLNIIESTDSLEYHIEKLQESYTFFNNNQTILDVNINDTLVSIKHMLDHYNSITNVNKIIQQSSNLEENHSEEESEDEKEQAEQAEEAVEESEDDADEAVEESEDDADEAVEESEDDADEAVEEEEEDVDEVLEYQEDAVEESEDEEEKASEPETIEEDYEEEKMLEYEEKENDNIENMEYYEVVMDIENEEGEEQETSFWTMDDENGDFYELTQNNNNKQYVKIGTFKDGEPYFDD